MIFLEFFAWGLLTNPVISVRRDILFFVFSSLVEVDLFFLDAEQNVSIAYISDERRHSWIEVSVRSCLSL